MMDGRTELVDAPARRIITTDLERTLFVEAGAGSGKTSSVVDRIVNLVDGGSVPVGRIAAITFTEAAATELRTRVRDKLEERAEDAKKASLLLAAGQVESAAFATLHAFALRMLSDHPIEAGLPPGFGVIDEITSTVEFEESWRIFTGQVGDDMALFDLQERAAALSVELRQFSGVARRFDDNWDLLDRVEPTPPTLTPVDFDDLLERVDELATLSDLCAVDGDRYLGVFQNFIGELEMIREREPLDQLQLLRAIRAPRKNWGKAASWRSPGLDHVRAEVDRFLTDVGDRVGRYRDEVMEYFITLVAEFVSARVERRQLKGELAFHDLLVLARRLLRTDETVRRLLHQRYTRILLDEFQDTDPIQIELAVLLASSEPVGDTPWRELAARLEPGRLVVVGDPKQSIYRFRRADIAVYAETEEVLVDEPTRLTTNFRSVPGILEWVNEVFGNVIGDGEPGRQPPYVALDPAREPGPDVGASVTVLGGPHERSTKVRQIRELEGQDVAAVVCRMVEEERLVLRDGQWLPVRLKDIAVLIPSRLSLPSLEAAFAATNVPFRPETSSLVYATQEVRDVLAGVRAVVDPSNSVDVVATLRSALFAIGDDDLLAWKLAGGGWDYRERHAPEIGPAHESNGTETNGTEAGHPLDGYTGGGSIAEAFAVLREWHADRWWMEPAGLIDRIVRERRLREGALAEPRPRDRWRRYRFLAEQAREFTEVQGGDLHDFVEWVEIQSSDLARVTEPIPAEPDDDAVRVLTVHGAKGLEFPVVILAGAPTEEQRARNGPKVIFPPEGRPQVKLGADRQTAEFDVHASLEELLDAHERIRLHYVAATRARDHLVVSAHHKDTGRLNSIGARTWNAIQDRPDLWAAFERRGDERYALSQPTQLRLVGGGFRDELAEWERAQRQIVEAAADARHWSATGLSTALLDDPERIATGVEVAGVDGPVPVGPEEKRDTSSPGAAIGTAVHAVLESIDFGGGPSGTEPDARELRTLARAKAREAGVADAADDVERKVLSALAAPSVELARNNPHWRELHVAVPTGRGTIEGYLDLCIETADGLIVVDYKTDRISADDLDAAVDRKVDDYRVQGAVYAMALEHLTGKPVTECRFVFLGAGGAGNGDAVERSLPDLRGAVAEVRQLLEVSSSV